MFFNSEHKENKIKLEKLQEKMKKSEMERRELEYKFENLMKERNKCENSAIKTLKYRYERFLDDEKKRNKRNEHLLKMLERIDYQAATLAAKTERLKMLKAQHELYLMKNWIPHSSFKSSQKHLLDNMQPSYALPHKQLTIPKQYSAPQYRPHQKHHNINLKSDFVKYLTDLNEFHNIQNPTLLNDGYNRNSSNDPNESTNKQTISTNQSQFNYDTINNQLNKNFVSPNYDTFSSSYTNNNNNKNNNNLPICQNQQNYKNPTYNIDYYETQSDNNNNNSYLQNNLPIIEIVPPVTTTTTTTTAAAIINESLLQKSITNMNDYNGNKINSNTTEMINNQCGEITNTEQMKNYQIKPQQLFNSAVPNIAGSIATLPLHNTMLDKPININNNNNNTNNTISISNTSANINNGTTNANINTNNIVVNDTIINNKNVMNNNDNNNNNNNNNNNTDNNEPINKFKEMNETVDKINLTNNIKYNDEENIKNGDGATATITIATTEQTTIPSPTPTTAAADIATIAAGTTINKAVHDINIEGHENIINTDNLLDKLNTINIDDLQEHMKNVNLNENENITNDVNNNVEKKEEQISIENGNVSDNIEGKAFDVASDNNVIDEINQIYDKNNTEQQKLFTHPGTNENNEIDDQSQDNVITENYDLINTQPSYGADDNYQTQPELYQENPKADAPATNPNEYDTVNPATNEYTENPEYYQPTYAEESENYQPQQLEQQIEQDQSHLNTDEMYIPTNEYQENSETYDIQNYDKEFVQEAQPIVDDQTLNYDQYDYTTTAVDGAENPEQQPAAPPNDTQNYDEYPQYQQQNENYDEYQQYYEQNPNDVAQNQFDDGQQQEQEQEQQQQQVEPNEYYDVNNYVTTEQQDQQQDQEQEQQQSTNEIYNEENTNYDQGFVTATENYRNEDDESSTTYSENINNVPQQIFETNENININAPNYLESETDESNNIQQTINENVIQNDESDFDFSTN